jgi:hypothetical protein
LQCHVHVFSSEVIDSRKRNSEIESADTRDCNVLARSFRESRTFEVETRRKLGFRLIDPALVSLHPPCLTASRGIETRMTRALNRLVGKRIEWYSR